MRYKLAMGKTVLITGGSRGIGAATARLAAQSGYRVALTYRREKLAAAQVVATIEQAGGEAFAMPGDVRDEATVCGWFDQVQQRFGSLDCLVNNAAIVAPQSCLADFSVERMRRVFDVNVLGAMLCLRQAVRSLSTKRGGRGGSIVNVSSAAAYVGSAGEYIDYAASKGALDTMTIGLAKEVATEGIRVNAVRPGLIDTQLHADGGEPGRVARLAASVPMQRGGRAEEVAAAIVWLASDEASYVTGALLNCSGGR